jgi:hypothetical protein
MVNIHIISKVFVGSGFIPDHFSVGYKTPPTLKVGECRPLIISILVSFPGPTGESRALLKVSPK